MISVIIFLIMVGFLLWLVNQIIPMEPTIRQIVNTVVIVATGAGNPRPFSSFGSIR